MDIQSFARGVEIFKSHFRSHHRMWPLAADRNEIRVCYTETPLEPGEVEELLSLGWRQRSTNYDPQEPWIAII